MKKFLLSMLTFVCVLCGAFAANLSTAKASASSYGDLVDFTVEVESGRDIRVLQITDTQIIDVAQSNRLGWAPDIWETDKMNEILFQCVTQVVTAYDPDLIILTGDVIYGEFDDNGTALTRLIAFMESFEIPWAPVFGNHDNESKRGVDWQCEQFENAEHCLFKQRKLTGNGNYSVGLVQDDQLKRVFYMMDSNGCGGASAQTLANGHTKQSSGFGTDQIEWYTQSMTAVKAAAPNVKFSMGFHIQNAAFVSAMSKYGYPKLGVNIDVAANRAEGDFGFFGHAAGETWDGGGSIFSGMKSLGVDSIFVGHEHQNSASIVYEGVRLAYGLKTGLYDTINWLTDGTIVDNEVTSGTVTGGNPLPGIPLVGGTAINVSQTDGSITSHHIYYEKEESKILDEKEMDISAASDMAYSTGMGRKYFEYYSVGVEGGEGDVYRANNLGKAYLAVTFGEEVMTGKTVELRLQMKRYETASSPILHFYKNEEGYDVSKAVEGEYVSISVPSTFNEWITVDITRAVQFYLNEDGTAKSMVLVFQANGVNANAEVFLDGIRSYREEKLGKEWEDIFYVTLRVDGMPVMEPVAFQKGDSKLNLPLPPAKAGFFGAWSYTLADKDCFADAVYVAEDSVTKVTFVADGVTVGQFAEDGEGNRYGEQPLVPQKQGYTGAWESYTVEDVDLTVNAVYTPITYYATFVADGAQVGEKISFTVEDESIAPPALPEKEGYVGKWEVYTLGEGDITVNAIYEEIPTQSADDSSDSEESADSESSSDDVENSSAESFAESSVGVAAGESGCGCGASASVLLPTALALFGIARFKRKEN